jgi:hypothetical protein
MTDTRDESLATRKFSRRTVAKGAVWSVPIIASVSLAPSAAAASKFKYKLIADCSTGTFSLQVISGTLPSGSVVTLNYTNPGGNGNIAGKFAESSPPVFIAGTPSGGTVTFTSNADILAGSTVTVASVTRSNNGTFTLTGDGNTATITGTGATGCTSSI